jgi:hypothetical protein
VTSLRCGPRRRAMVCWVGGLFVGARLGVGLERLAADGAEDRAGGTAGATASCTSRSTHTAHPHQAHLHQARGHRPPRLDLAEDDLEQVTAIGAVVWQPLVASASPLPAGTLRFSRSRWTRGLACCL